MLRATCLGLVLGLLILQLFGTYTALAARSALDYAGLMLLLHGPRHSMGRVYWYRAGWNERATVSRVLRRPRPGCAPPQGARPGQAIGPAVGLAAVSTSLYEGPLPALSGSVDCNFALSGLVSGASCRVSWAARAA